MIQRLIQYFLLAVFFLVTLSLERVIGLPLLFCVILGIWIQDRAVLTQVYWVIGLGVVLASLYMIPMAVGIVLLAALVAWLELSSKVVKQEVFRLLIGSEGVVIGLSLLIRVNWTPQTVLAHLIKLAFVSILVIIFVNRTNQRQGLGIVTPLRKR